jgi:hypothetical protein
MMRHIYLSMALVLVLAGLAAAQWAQAVLEPVLTSANNENLGVNALALDGLGRLHLVYDLQTGTDHNLYYKSKPQGGTWSAGVPLGDQSLAQGDPYLTVQKNTGVPYLVFVQGGDLVLGVGGAIWQYYTLPLSGGAISARFPAVAVDANALVHVAMIVSYEGAYKIGYGFWDGQSFHYQTIFVSQPGPYGLGAAPDITVLSNGAVAISYRAGDYSTYRIEVAQNSQIGGDVWEMQSLQPAGFNNYTSSLRSTSNDNLYLAFDGDQGWGFPGHVFYCTKPHGMANWSAPFDVSGNLGGKDPHLAMQENGTAYLVWQRTSGNIYTGDIIFASNISGNWVSQILQSGDRYNPSLAVDAAGNGSLAFERYTTQNDIYYYGYVTPVSPPQHVEITLTPINPPVLIGPSGGTFSYNISIANVTPTPQNFQIWVKLRLPHGGLYGPVTGPVSISNMPSGTTFSRMRNQLVPANAPSGNYACIGYAGSYPGIVADSSWFPFTKNTVRAEATSEENWESSFVGHKAETQNRLTISPNPFNPTTVVSFKLPVGSHVRLNVFDTAGRLVSMLVDGWREAGDYEVKFDGSKLPGGVYLYWLEAGGEILSGKMVLVK